MSPAARAGAVASASGAPIASTRNKRRVVETKRVIGEYLESWERRSEPRSGPSGIEIDGFGLPLLVVGRVFLGHMKRIARLDRAQRGVRLGAPGGIGRRVDELGRRAQGAVGLERDANLREIRVALRWSG